MAQYKVLSTMEQIITVDEETGVSTVISSRVTNSSIVSINNQILNAGRAQLSTSEVKYGYIAFRKSNILRNIYSPGKIVNVLIHLSPNGSITGRAKFHLSQSRLDGLTPIFSQIPDLEARVFDLSYNPTSNDILLAEV